MSKTETLFAEEESTAEATLPSWLETVGLSAMPESMLTYIDPREILIPDGETLPHDTALQASILAVGILEPPLVSRLLDPLPDKKYQVIFGRRRTKASQDIALPAMKCFVIEASTPGLEAILALTENGVRAPEWLRSVKCLRLLLNVVRLSEEELYKRGFKKQSLKTYLAIAKLPDDLFARLQNGEISFKAAKALTALSEESQRKVVAECEEITDESIKEALRVQIDTPLSDLFAQGLPQVEAEPQSQTDFTALIEELHALINADCVDFGTQTLAQTLLTRLERKGF